MTDPIERLRAANPVVDLPSRPVEELWRRLEDDDRRPEPRLSRSRPLARPKKAAHHLSIGGIMVGISTLTAVAIAAIAIVLLDHGRSGTGAPSHVPASNPARSVRTALPVGSGIRSPSGVGSTDPGAAVLRTVKLQVQTRDPEGGLVWAMRDFQTTAGETCLQAGRFQDQTIGVIGQDGAWGNDHRFHPIDPNATAADFCAETDGNGLAFENVIQNETASGGAGPEELRFIGCGIAGARHAIPCRKADLRVLQYGLLGPDAASITYLGPTGRSLSEPTTGPDGAYLIVERATRYVCGRLGSGSGCGREAAAGGLSAGSSLFAGLVTSVQYRDGRVCQVPAPPPPSTPAGTPQRSCPPVGYQAPLTAHPTAADLTAPVSARKLPGRLLVDIAFTARVAVTSDDSYYEYTLTPASAAPRGCSNDSGENTLQAFTGGSSPDPYIRAGQRVVLEDQIKAGCRGTLSGTVAYVPNIGPQGTEYPDGFISQARSTTVGHFSLTIP